MQTDDQKGHRDRLRERFIQNNELDDRQLLELLLTYAIPRKDVRKIAVDLLNAYKNIEGVLNATNDELSLIDGIGENASIFISLIKTLANRILLERNEKIDKLDSAKQAIEYCENILKSSQYEKFIAISLSNNLDIINYHIISTGGVNQLNVDIQKLFQHILNDRASHVIVAHNHPKGSAIPSAQDKDTTINILQMCRSFNLHLKDHIIVGESNSIALSEYLDTSEWFD